MGKGRVNNFVVGGEEGDCGWRVDFDRLGFDVGEEVDRSWGEVGFVWEEEGVEGDVGVDFMDVGVGFDDVVREDFYGGFFFDFLVGGWVGGFGCGDKDCVFYYDDGVGVWG